MKLPWQSKSKVEVLSPLEGYNKWAATYSQESNPIKNLSNDQIEKWLPDVRGKTVLDAGCGTGHFCQLLEKRQAGKVEGLDLSPAMIEIARKVAPSTEFVCADLSTPLEKERFDLVICALVLGHLSDVKPVLDNLLASLKKGGTILISDFHPYLTLQHAKRTFQDDAGETFEIVHHLHLFRDFIKCFRQQQVVIENWEEPVWNNLPVIYVIQAKKMQWTSC